MATKTTEERLDRLEDQVADLRRLVDEVLTQQVALIDAGFAQYREYLEEQGRRLAGATRELRELRGLG